MTVFSTRLPQQVDTVPTDINSGTTKAKVEVEPEVISCENGEAQHELVSASNESKCKQPREDHQNRDPPVVYENECGSAENHG